MDLLVHLKFSQKINLPFFIVSAWHHRLDAFSSVGSLIGINGFIAGFKILDFLVDIIIGIIILKV